MQLQKNILLIFPLLFLIFYLVFHKYIFSFATTFSCILIAAYFYVRFNSRKSELFIIMAFAFSIAGDWMLKTRSTNPMGFVYGILLFFIAHVCYLAFCLKNGRLHIMTLVVLTVLYVAYYLTFLRPAISDSVLNIAVLVYTLVSCVSLSAAAGLSIPSPTKVLFIIGIACLLFSDTLISFHEFLHQSFLYELMMPTYFASQILVTAALLNRKIKADA